MATIAENNGDAGSDTTTQYTLSLGDVFLGTLEPAADTDWVRIELTAGTIYKITLTGDRSTHLVIQNPDHELIYHTRTTDTDKKIIFDPIDTGTYYFRVKNSDKGYSGDYQLSLDENTIPIGSYDEIANYLAEGYNQELTDGSRGRQIFDIKTGDELTVNITGITEASQQYARWALEAWTYVSGITFKFVDQDAHISFSDSQEGNFASTGLNYSGITDSAFVNVSAGSRDISVKIDSHVLAVYIHEIGHALGLGHPGLYGGGGVVYGDSNKFLIDSEQITVMSYFSQARNTYVRASSANPVTPMIVDILAIHELYDVPSDINAGDTVFGYQSNTGSYLDTFFEQWVAGTLRYPVALTLYDTGGNDTLDLRTDTNDQRVDLYPEGISDVYGLIGNLIIARDTLIENFIAGSGNDFVIGN